jgi:hypothetical protein
MTQGRMARRAGKPGRIGWHPAAKVLTFPLPGAGGAEPRLFHHSRECQAMVKKVLTRRLRRTAGPHRCFPSCEGPPRPPPCMPRRTGRHRGMPASPLCDTSDAIMRRRRRQYASADPPVCRPLRAAISEAAPPGSSTFSTFSTFPSSSPARPGGARPPCGAGRACSTIRDSVKPWLAKD